MAQGEHKHNWQYGDPFSNFEGEDRIFGSVNGTEVKWFVVRFCTECHQYELINLISK